MSKYLLIFCDILVVSPLCSFLAGAQLVIMDRGRGGEEASTWISFIFTQFTFSSNYSFSLMFSSCQSVYLGMLEVMTCSNISRNERWTNSYFSKLILFSFSVLGDPGPCQACLRSGRLKTLLKSGAFG